MHLFIILAEHGDSTDFFIAAGGRKMRNIPLNFCLAHNGTTMPQPLSASIDTLELREVSYGSPHYHAVVALRQHVLRSPLGLTYTPDQLAQDAHDRQFVALQGDQLVGGVMLHAQDATTAKLRQFVVTPSLQGFGIGSRLLRLFEQAARESGYTQVVLSARETATNFYRKHGYETQGERYLQIGLPHVMMQRKL